MSFAEDADTTFRDYETDNVPASGGHKPQKSAIRALLRGTGTEESLFKYISSAAIRNAISAQAVDHTDAGMLTELTTNMNTALSEGPLGGTLLLPPGDIPVNDTVVNSRQMNIRAPGGTRLIGWMADARNLMNIRLDEAASGFGDARRQRIEGFTAYFATNGLHVLDVENQSPLAANLHMDFRYLGLGGNDSGSGVALRFGGVVTQVHTVEHCGIDNGVWLDGCADSCVLRDNLMGGTKVAVLIQVAEGAFKTLVEHNTIVTRDGAITIIDGAEIDIIRNQMEQSGTNASTHQATIAILASLYGNRTTVIAANNFGGGGNVERSIWVDGAGSYFVDDLDIREDNAFNTCNSAVDIVFNSSKVRWARVHPKQRLRGNRNGVIITGSTAAANSVDAEVTVTDSGLGTMGVWQPASTLSLSNSWTASTDFGYMKDAAGIVHFRGHLIGGTMTGGTVFGAMPAGFRPSSDAYIVCGNSATTTCAIGVQAGGNLVALGTGTTSSEVNVTPYKAARHTKYDPGA